MRSDVARDQRRLERHLASFTCPGREWVRLDRAPARAPRSVGRSAVRREHVLEPLDEAASSALVRLVREHDQRPAIACAALELAGTPSGSKRSRRAPSSIARTHVLPHGSLIASPGAGVVHCQNSLGDLAHGSIKPNAARCVGTGVWRFRAFGLLVASTTGVAAAAAARVRHVGQGASVTRSALGSRGRRRSGGDPRARRTLLPLASTASTASVGQERGNCRTTRSTLPQPSRSGTTST